MFSTFFWRCEPAARAWWEKLRLKRWKTGGKSPVSESSGVELSHFWALLSFSHTSRLIRGLSVICNSAHKAHDTLCSYFSSTLTNPALNVSGPQFPHIDTVGPWKVLKQRHGMKDHLWHYRTVLNSICSLRWCARKRGESLVRILAYQLPLQEFSLFEYFQGCT